MSTTELSTVEEIAATHTAPPVGADQPSKAEEIAASHVPPEVQKPEGAPDFYPLSSLRRRKRADYQKALIKDLPGELVEGMQGSEGVDMKTAGLLDFAVSYLANLEDAYKILAVDQNAYDNWAKRCSDEDLEQLHTWYEAQYSPGEA